MATVDIVLFVHSVVRTLVLLAAIVGLVKTLFSLVRKSGTAPLDRTISAVFLGLFDLQALLGLLIILLGGLSNALHPVLMFVGLVVAHGMQRMRRTAEGTNAHVRRLAFYVVPLAIIVAGLAVIGRLMM